jgi:RNA polymerase sigma-70 factor (ECF subfamily)
MNKTSAKENDDQLIQATLGGNRDAFGRLICKYQDRLYNGMVQVTRDETEAEDIVQEAFILALTKLNTFRGKSAFFTWLYRIAYNVAITRLRRKRPTVPLGNRADENQLQLTGDEPQPDDGLEKREQAHLLMQGLDKLSEEHRVILVLREMEELDYEAIAEVLDLPIGTVRSRLHRARLQLKQQLELLFER